MKFRIILSDSSHKWHEDYNVFEVTSKVAAEKYATRMIENFNLGLRPNEKPRKLVRIEIGKDDCKLDHYWEKLNLVTERDRTGSFDRLRCKRCSATARRYGISSIVRDKKFKDEKYISCNPPRIVTVRRKVKK